MQNFVFLFLPLLSKTNQTHVLVCLTLDVLLSAKYVSNLVHDLLANKVMTVSHMWTHNTHAFVKQFCCFVAH